jgi:hypothetical protein
VGKKYQQGGYTVATLRLNPDGLNDRMGFCEVHRKTTWRSRKVARRELRNRHPEGGKTPYRCPHTRGWHYGTPVLTRDQYRRLGEDQTMGWCSATDIMDVALAAADAAMEHVLKRVSQDGANAADVIMYERDDILRPFVAQLATKLREEDWDCIEESDFFDRFPQEMLGHDDAEYRQWIERQLGDALADHEEDRINHWNGILQAHVTKMNTRKGS